MLLCSARALACNAWLHIVEANEVDVRAAVVFCDLEQIENSKESRFTRELGVMSENPIVSMESISMAPWPMRYLLPTKTCGRVQKRTLQVISPLRTPSRSRLVNIMSVQTTIERRKGSECKCDLSTTKEVTFSANSPPSLTCPIFRPSISAQ
jgi:hypothetical protein